MTQSPAFIPPQDYQQVKSAVPGIQVFAPKPKVDHATDAKTYDCPQCGASLSFDLATSGIGCPYCGYQQKVEAQHVGNAAQRSEFTLETMNNAQKGWGGMRQQLHCDNCGAELSYPAGAIASSCPYCASNKVNVQVSADDKMRPRFLVPFKLKSDQLPAIASTWLGKGWLHPKNLATNTLLRQFNGIYLPYWVFDTDIDAQWKAEVGREERYRVYNASSKRWETRTRIVWEWKQGRIYMPVKDFLQIGIRDQLLSHHMLKKIEPYHLTDLVAYQPDFLVGLQAQAYDITLPDAWEKTKQTLRENAKNACRQSITSPHVRNFSMTADFGDEAWRYVLVPIFMAAYRYHEQTYQVMINGQTGTITGQKPVERWKVNLITGLSFLPAFVLGLIALITYLYNGEFAPLICTGFVLLIIGIVISIVIHRKAKEAGKGV